MNERTKRILSYVACGLGGLALGIALLGGLSYCSVSEKAEQTKVNTILTEPKREQITTTNGGYTGYTFTPHSTNWAMGLGTGYAYAYGVDPSTWTLSESIATPFYATGINGIDSIKNVIELAIDWGNESPEITQTLRFLAFYSRANVWGNTRKVMYFTFFAPRNTNINVTPFLITTENSFSIFNLQTEVWANSSTTSKKYYLTSERSNQLLLNYDFDNPSQSYTFQDVISYYKELGYQDGYDEGETVGYNSGYADGFDDGSDNGLLFTDLGVNQLTWARSDITYDDQTDTTATMKLFDFKDGENQSYYVSFTDYSLGGGTPTVEVYKNGTASNNLFARIASGTWNNSYTQLEVIPSTYLKFEFAQITTYYHNSIPNGWFTLSGIPANATGYEVGYQTGYREGYLASPGGQATENVFSLFTNAFDSVGGIFNMKIFGFLPLYWFFLTPIFIAIIALLLRLVKH